MPSLHYPDLRSEVPEFSSLAEAAGSSDPRFAEVAYTARPTRRSGPLPSTTNWDVLEFIARVVEHIPEPSQQMTRYWGL
ncbi:MAG: hypothetical protein EP299_05500 [Acidobacteria bacterium]|nr:MAG: hypothetical protein EP299_05500 [Acidobacteriota bacterium]